MTAGEPAGFLSGVIEGFYGKPWTDGERRELFGWMAAWGLNTYVYAPKDDLKHRAVWREDYSEAEARALRETIRACHEHRLRFVYALGPGLDLRYSAAADADRLRGRFGQMLTLGCRDFALLFDDIPDRLDAEDLRRWGSLAAAQSQLTNALFGSVRERCPESRFFFCPTPYCGRMAERRHGGEGYLEGVGRELRPEIEVFWTGPEIVSEEIGVAHLQAVGAWLRRRPLLWDNLHANDYDGRRFHCGPLAGRPPEVRNHVSGLLVNPNCEFPLNFVPLRTLAAFVRSEGTWDSRAAYLEALREWFSRFTTVGAPLAFEDLVLFGDCFYLPHREGPEAEAFLQRARAALRADSTGGDEAAAAFRRPAARLREFCGRLADLRDRPLFHALWRRVWDLREELDLLERGVAARSEAGNPEGRCRSDFHLPGTYRGGMVARLQRLLTQHPDGSFTPNR
jgi:protein O-GlcNAcase/histone acetyltransferase